MRAPLLVIDGDSFAHRAYHALPKTIRRRGGKGAGAILGFANYLLRFHESEKPRAVLVAWDTLDAPTYRRDALPGYQSGREFDDELVDQLEALPEFVTACGFACAKAAGYEADDFLAAAVAREERRGGTAIVATGDRDAYQLASGIAPPSCNRFGPASWRASARPRYGPGMASTRSRCRTSSPCAATAQTAYRASPAWGQAAGRCQRAAQVRLARECHQSRTLCAPSSVAAPLSLDRDHGQDCAAASAAQSEAQLGKGRGARAPLAAWKARRAAESPWPPRLKWFATMRSVSLSPRRSLARARAAVAAIRAPGGLVRRTDGEERKRQACEVRHGAQKTG
jgi:hypothetical protein